MEQVHNISLANQKKKVAEELNELTTRIYNGDEVEESGEEEHFVDILDSAFGSTPAVEDKLDNFDSFLQEHKKIDEKLVNTKQSKLFLIKSKTKRVRKSNSLSSFHSHSKPGLYELDNSSRGTLPHKLIRKISRRSPGSLRPVESAKQTYLPETLNEESSLASSTDGLNDKDVVTYKKVFKAETEDARDEVFQFQFEFTKLKLDDDKLKFSDDVNNAIQKQDFEENKSTTLISNSNGNVITTTIKPKQLKKIFPGFGISNGIASLYTSIFGWSKSG